MNKQEETLVPVLVWDIATRLFHWLIVGLVGLAWFSAETGGNWMTTHIYCGYAILTLLIFRVLWGFLGSTYARFGNFLYGVPTTFNYALALLKRQPTFYLGHNPLGSWSVFLLLTLLFIQVGTGLFANDDIMTEGPLYNWVANETSGLLTEIHEINFNVLLVTIFLHFSAILFYFFVKGENLVRPMLSGYKWISPTQSPEKIVKMSLWRAVLLLVLATGAVYLLVGMLPIHLC